MEKGKKAPTSPFAHRGEDGIAAARNAFLAGEAIADIPDLDDRLLAAIQAWRVAVRRPVDER